MGNQLHLLHVHKHSNTSAYELIYLFATGAHLVKDCFVLIELELSVCLAVLAH